MSADLEFLRDLFRDDRLHVGIGTIVKLGPAPDQSALRVQVNLLPENREVVAMMTWDDIGRITFPEIADLCIVNFCDGHPDEAHVMRLLTTSEEKISAFAFLGHTITNSRPGKKNYIGSDTKVGIGRIDVEPTEPLVLGTTLIAGLTALVDALVNNASDFADNSPAAILSAQMVGATIGPCILNAAVVTALNNFKETYLTTSSSNVVSQIAFTERGV